MLERGENKKHMDKLVADLLEVYCGMHNLQLGQITEEVTNKNDDPTERERLRKEAVDKERKERGLKEKEEKARIENERSEKLRIEKEQINTQVEKDKAENDRIRLEQEKAKSKGKEKEVHVERASNESTGFTTKQVKQWTSEDVANWMASLSLSTKNPIVITPLNLHFD